MTGGAALPRGAAGGSVDRRVIPRRSEVALPFRHSRNTINGLRSASAMSKLRLLPSEARRRGLPAVGFDLVVAPGVTLEPPPAGTVALVVEADADGRRIGELSIEVVAAGLIVDRDGALAQLANRRAPIVSPYPVTLDAGATGFRADLVRGDRPALPYQSFFALAPRDVGGFGAIVVAVHTVAPAWPAGDAMLASLRVFCRDTDARVADVFQGR